MARSNKSYGEEYGYPDCCIEAFGDPAIPFFMRSELVRDATQRVSNVMHESTGYVPCEECAKKILDGGTLKLVEEINERRTHKTPFPKS